MYQPPQFVSREPLIAARLMREHPFASLISTDDEGFPFVTHLPLHLEDSQNGFTLLGHVAKPNPHWKYLATRPKALVTFVGPHAFLSPKVYPDLARVPSWNYLALHCTVEAKIIDEVDSKDALLKKLIADHEPPYAAQWRSLGEEFAHKMLAGIVAFELKIVDWQCKLKLNQHRQESHAALHATYAAGGPNEQALAVWMQTLNMVPGIDSRQHSE
ncbi:FMN-binding negative transcriptional regulator [Ottowia caeni]|uniref:FMN-binding negative transcriptional regulator n=1 Tax=Ottowia caeni TaxID=2870339 RepID=UPI001E64159A|nr:FMN-binding negative transcriptional regulator [Ottowia caeni]